MIVVALAASRVRYSVTDRSAIVSSAAKNVFTVSGVATLPARISLVIVS